MERRKLEIIFLEFPPKCESTSPERLKNLKPAQNILK
jgi:hypothetical protein